MTAPRFAMAVNTLRCVGCSACVLACKAENDLPTDGFRCWITVETEGRFPALRQEIRTERCNHCDHPACVDACPTGASYVDDGGTVLVDRDKCTGCKACMAACPYGARYVTPAGYVDKCTFCLHRVRESLQPACVTVCPTGALAFGDLNDPRSAASTALSKHGHRTLEPDRGFGPRVYYRT